MQIEASTLLGVTVASWGCGSSSPAVDRHPDATEAVIATIDKTTKHLKVDILIVQDALIPTRSEALTTHEQNPTLRFAHSRTY